MRRLPSTIGSNSFVRCPYQPNWYDWNPLKHFAYNVDRSVAAESIGVASIVETQIIFGFRSNGSISSNCNSRAGSLYRLYVVCSEVCNPPSVDTFQSNDQ